MFSNVARLILYRLVDCVFTVLLFIIFAVFPSETTVVILTTHLCVFFVCVCVCCCTLNFIRAFVGIFYSLFPSFWLFFLLSFCIFHMDVLRLVFIRLDSFLRVFVGRSTHSVEETLNICLCVSPTFRCDIIIFHAYFIHVHSHSFGCDENKRSRQHIFDHDSVRIY